MRHGFRWVSALLVLALMLPAAAGALPARGASFGSAGWNPWSRLVAFVSALFGSDTKAQKSPPQIDQNCGIDPNGAPKCTD
jgi:hypothetical protein